MLARLRDLLVLMVTTPTPRTFGSASATRTKLVASFTIAILVGAWLFVYKVRDFVGLGTTSDLYTFVQMSTLWPDRGFFHDNWAGNSLTIHTSLFSPVLWPLTQPFGAFGLFVALALAFGSSVLAMERLLKLFAVPGGLALGFAAVATLMPLSAYAYQDSVYGFHLELLEPAFALWLAYHLFRRAWGWAVLNALALVSLKEDAPLLVMAVAATVLGEDFLRALLTPRLDPNSSRWNRPALGMFGMGALAIPALLFLLKTQQPPGAPVNLSRLNIGGSALSPHSYQELFAQVFGNLGTWLQSAPVADWSRIVVPATFGLALLRPHLAIFGLVATVVAWLRHDNLIWGPRFVQALALFQLVGCLGFASIWQLIAGVRMSRWLSGGLVTIAVVAAIWMSWLQFGSVPEVGAFYALRPPQRVSTADRLRADRLFDIYRREGEREEPTVATTYLFRYAHDRNLFWPDYLKGRPKPIWILWDTDDRPVMALWTILRRDVGVDLADYELRGREGRFVLLKRNERPEAKLTLGTGIPAITGEPFGSVRLRVTFPAKQVGHSEPLLSVGRNVFQVSYQSADRIVLGVEQIGEEVHRSDSIDINPAREHEIELFSGALYPPKDSDETPAAVSRRNFYEYLLNIRFDGRDVLRKYVLQRGEWSRDVAVGINRAQAGSTGMAFTGSIRSAQRGGFPVMPGSPEAEIGALRMRIVLPAAAAGTPEPLLVMGEPGAAFLAYVRVLSKGKIKLGVEQWGVGAVESGEVSADSRAPIEVTFEWPGLFPPIGDPRWGATPPARQEQARSQVRVTVDEKAVLTWPHMTRDCPNVDLYPGRNPLGGSLVGSAFTGKILWVVREAIVNH